MNKYTQDEINQVFGLTPAKSVGGIPVSQGGSSFYINESNWESIGASDRGPRQCDVHCCQMNDGTILVFDDYVPDEEEEFNNNWILALNTRTGETLVDHEDQYSCDVLQILMETGIESDGTLKSN